MLYNRALYATNCNIDARANIVAVYTNYHCIVQSVQYQIIIASASADASADLSADMPENRLTKLKINLKHSRML